MGVANGTGSINGVDPVEIDSSDMGKAQPSSSEKRRRTKGQQPLVRYTLTGQNDCNLPVCGRVALCFITWTVAVYVCSYAVHVAGNRNPSSNYSTNHQLPLPDYGFEIFPYIEVQSVPVVGLDGLFIVLCAIAMLTLALFHRVRTLILRRVFVIWTILVIYRGLSMVVTSPPDPNPACRDRHSVWDWKPAYYPGGITCGDLMYSGHSCFYLLSALIFQQYTRAILLQILVWFVAFLGMWGLIAVRVHYTVDVVIAAYITVSLFVLYHWLMDPESKKLHRSWRPIHRILSWIEYLPPETMQPINEDERKEYQGQGTGEEKEGLLATDEGLEP